MKLVVVEVAERLQAADERMEPKAALLDELPAPRVRRVDDGQAIAFSNAVNSVHEAQKVRFIVDVLLAVRGEQEILLRREPEACEHVARRNLFLVRLEHFPHRRACNEHRLTVDALRQEIPPRVFRVWQVDVGDVVDNRAVHHFRNVPVPATVACLHMKNGNLKPLCRNRGQRGVRVTEDE